MTVRGFAANLVAPTLSALHATCSDLKEIVLLALPSSCNRDPSTAPATDACHWLCSAGSAKLRGASPRRTRSCMVWKACSRWRV